MTDYNMKKEVREAINAGEVALASLRTAQTYLNSAGNWGLLDMFGGHSIVGLIKHMKINNANNCLYQAKSDLMRFRDELDDVDAYVPNVEVGGFLTFADFFFDGLLADIIVQSRIGEMKRQVGQAISQVERILRSLKSYA